MFLYTDACQVRRTTRATTKNKENKPAPVKLGVHNITTERGFSFVPENFDDFNFCADPISAIPGGPSFLFSPHATFLENAPEFQ